MFLAHPKRRITFLALLQGKRKPAYLSSYCPASHARVSRPIHCGFVPSIAATLPTRFPSCPEVFVEDRPSWAMRLSFASSEACHESQNCRCITGWVQDGSSIASSFSFPPTFHTSSYKVKCWGVYYASHPGCSPRRTIWALGALLFKHSFVSRCFLFALFGAACGDLTRKVTLDGGL